MGVRINRTLATLVVAVAVAAPARSAAQSSRRGAPVPTLGQPAPTRTWPLCLALQALIGAEVQDRGTPIAFGMSAELLWRARIGGFAGLLSSSGTPVLPTAVEGRTQPALADRISVPFGIAARPFGTPGTSWWARVAGGIGAQLGATIEHLRVSSEGRTVVGLHAALSVDLPLWGSAIAGGLFVRLQGRLILAPVVELLENRSVLEPLATGQLFAGLSYTP